jgi:hypothetical protein
LGLFIDRTDDLTQSEEKNMATPIYKVFMGKPSEAWYALSTEEQANLLAKVSATLGQVGGKQVILCNAQWVGDQWSFWGVEQFPDLEAVQTHTALLAELNWFRYIDGMAVLGTEWQATQ